MPQKLNSLISIMVKLVLLYVVSLKASVSRAYWWRLTVQCYQSTSYAWSSSLFKGLWHHRSGEYEFIREWRAQPSSGDIHLHFGLSCIPFHVPNYTVSSLPLVCSLHGDSHLAPQLALTGHLLWLRCCTYIIMISAHTHLSLRETRYSPFTSRLETSSSVPKVTRPDP